MKTIISLVLLCLPLSGWATVINYLPYTVSAPGVYTLERNLTGTAAILITIKSSDVVLDLGGYTLSGSASQWAIHVESSTSVPATNLPGFGGNVKIRNGGIRNIAGGGIFFDGTIWATAEDLTIQAGTQAIQDQAGDGDTVKCCNLYNFSQSQPTVAFLDTANCLIENNHVYSGGGSPGIQSGYHSVHVTNAIIGNFVTTPGPVVLDIVGDINSGNFIYGLGGAVNL